MSSDEEEPELSELWAKDASTTPVAVRSGGGGAFQPYGGRLQSNGNSTIGNVDALDTHFVSEYSSGAWATRPASGTLTPGVPLQTTQDEPRRGAGLRLMRSAEALSGTPPPNISRTNGGDRYLQVTPGHRRPTRPVERVPFQDTSNGSSGFAKNVNANSSSSVHSGASEVPSLRPVLTPGTTYRGSPANFMAMRFGLALESGNGDGPSVSASGGGGSGGSINYSREQFTDAFSARTDPASPDSAGMALRGRSLLPGGLISPDNNADESDEHGYSYSESTAGAGSPTPLIGIPIHETAENSSSSSGGGDYGAYGARSAVFPPPSPQLLDAGSAAFVPGQGRMPPPNHSNAITVPAAPPAPHYPPYDGSTILPNGQPWRGTEPATSDDHEDGPLHGRHLEAEWERDSSTVILNGYASNPGSRPPPPPQHPPPLPLAINAIEQHQKLRQGPSVPGGPLPRVESAQLDADTEAHLNQVAYSLALQRFQRQQQMPQPPPMPPMQQQQPFYQPGSSVSGSSSNSSHPAQSKQTFDNEAELAQQHLAQRTAWYMQQFMAQAAPPSYAETHYRGGNKSSYNTYNSTSPQRPSQRLPGTHLAPPPPPPLSHPPPGAHPPPIPPPVPPPGPPPPSLQVPLPGSRAGRPLPPPPHPPPIPPPAVQVLNSTAGAALPAMSSQASVYQPMPPQGFAPQPITTTMHYHGVAPPLPPPPLPPPPPFPPQQYLHDPTHSHHASTAAAMGGTRRGTRHGQGEASTGRNTFAVASSSGKSAAADTNSRSGNSNGNSGSSSSGGKNNCNDAVNKASNSSKVTAERALVESPGTKLAFKEFCRQFRLLEKQGSSESNTTGDGGNNGSSSSGSSKSSKSSSTGSSSGDASEGATKSTGAAAARAYAHRCLTNDLLPVKAHWRVYLELAELAKREHRWTDAQKLHCKACEAQPFAAQAWLDWAKMEDERGALEQAGKVLRYGLRFCEFSEPLLTRAIRHEERLCASQEAAAAARASCAAAVLSPPPSQLQPSPQLLLPLEDGTAVCTSSAAAESVVERSSTGFLRDENNDSSGATSSMLGNVEVQASVWLKKLPLQEREKLEKCVEDSFWEQARAMHKEKIGKGGEISKEEAEGRAKDHDTIESLHSSDSSRSGSQAQSKELTGAAEVALSLAATRVAQSFDLPADGHLAAAVVRYCVCTGKNAPVSSTQPKEGGGEALAPLPRTPTTSLSTPSVPPPETTVEAAIDPHTSEGGGEGTSGSLDRARGLLARLKHTTIDKVWRTVLEGALLEARSGQISAARSVFKYLMEHVPWHGPIYHEAMRLEERCERPFAALSIVHRGLQEIPRYGPLWFGLFRVAEQVDMEEWLRSVRLYAGAQRRKQRAMRLQSEEEGVYNLTSRSKTDSAAGGGLGDVDSSSYSSGGADVLERPPLEPPMARTREAITAAMSAVSKELIWKVQFEAAAIEERTATACRRELVVWRKEFGGLHNIAESLAEISRTACAEAAAAGIKDEAAAAAATASSMTSSAAPLEAITPGASSTAGEATAEGNGGGGAGTNAGVFTPPGQTSAAVMGSSLGAAPDAHVDCRLHDGLAGARAALASAVLACFANLRWKVWLAGGRLELAGPDNLLLPESDHHQGQAEGTAAAHEDGEGSIVSLRRAAKDGALRRARALFACAHCEVPSKNTAQVVLECARLEEYVGNGDLARKILRRACQDARFEWKLFLEVVLLEMRARQWSQASRAAVSALQLHSGTGRLWATLIQLRARPAAWDHQLVSDRNAAHQRLERAVVHAAAAAASRDDNGESDAAAADALGAFSSASATAMKRQQRSEALRWRKWSGAAGLPLSIAAPYAVIPQALEGAASAYEGMSQKSASADNDDITTEELAGAEAIDSDSAAVASATASAAATLSRFASVTRYSPFGVQSWDYTWAQQATLAAALAEVPKSGEVWCEGARCCLNPLGRAFDPHAAQRYLEFSTTFTPQYGDSFVEQLRLHLLTVHVLPRARAMAAAHAPALDQLASAYLSAALASSSSPSSSSSSTPTQHHSHSNHSSEGGDHSEEVSFLPRSVRSRGGADGPLAHLLLACEEAGLLSADALLMPLSALQDCLDSPVANKKQTHTCRPSNPSPADYNLASDRSTESSTSNTSTANGRGLCLQDLEQTAIERLERRCANADPNYGNVWFQCRSRTHETARSVLKQAQKWASKELLALAPLYMQAWVRRLLVERALVAMVKASDRFRAADAALSHPQEANNESDSSSSSSNGDESSSIEAHIARLQSMDAKSRAAYRLARAALPEPEIDQEKEREVELPEIDGIHEGHRSDGTARTNGRAWEGACECALRRAAPINPQVLGVLPRPEDFITGLVGLNRHEARVNELSDEQRRKILFGCDQSVL